MRRTGLIPSPSKVRLGFVNQMTILHPVFGFTAYPMHGQIVRSFTLSDLVRRADERIRMMEGRDRVNERAKIVRSEHRADNVAENKGEVDDLLMNESKEKSGDAMIEVGNSKSDSASVLSNPSVVSSSDANSLSVESGSANFSSAKSGSDTKCGMKLVDEEVKKLSRAIDEYISMLANLKVNLQSSIHERKLADNLLDIAQSMKWGAKKSRCTSKFNRVLERNGLLDKEIGSGISSRERKMVNAECRRLD